jgi:F-type H+-transporting ATPase subunit d
MSSRSAVAKIDWTRLTSALSLNSQTTFALTSFRKRNVDAHTKRNQLKAARTEIDFGYYRRTLKNQAVIDQIEKAAKEFKTVTYDVSTVLSGIDSFEEQAVKSAKETEEKINEQLIHLGETIKNINQARHPDDFTVYLLSIIMAYIYIDG